MQSVCLNVGSIWYLWDLTWSQIDYFAQFCCLNRESPVKTSDQSLFKLSQVFSKASLISVYSSVAELAPFVARAGSPFHLSAFLMNGSGHTHEHIPDALVVVYRRYVQVQDWHQSSRHSGDLLLLKPCVCALKSVVTSVFSSPQQMGPEEGRNANKPPFIVLATLLAFGQKPDFDGHGHLSVLYTMGQKNCSHASTVFCSVSSLP